MTLIYVPGQGGFWMDKTEVTNAMYSLCVNSGYCSRPAKSTMYTLGQYYGEPTYANYPVVYVNYNQAKSYCEWAGRRLPTEAEWVAAAQGTDGRIFPWGNSVVDGTRANVCDTNCTLEELVKDGRQDTSINDGYAYTAPVGSFPAGASPYGILDMAGNVWEWTSTISGGSYVIRGGGWTNLPSSLRNDHKYLYVPEVAWVDTTFRCALSP
jgi:serine/threonine-protein kinase